MPTEILTAAFVERLRRHPPAAGRVEHWDAKTPGLCIRVSATGAASWSFRYRPRNGAGHQRVTLGKLIDLGLADARERAAQYRASVIDGTDPQRERMTRRAAANNTLTFGLLAQQYLDQYAKPREASWRNDASYLKRPRELWGERDAKTISRRDCIVLLDDIKQAAPVSANRTHSVLVTLFNWAVEDQLLDANPVAGLRKRALEQPKERVLTEAEICVLWRALDAANDTRKDVTAALQAILVTGQRPGEVAGAAQGELVALNDPQDARWDIPAGRMKARRAHIVPLAPMARRLFLGAIERRRAQEDKAGVFASRFLSPTTLARHSLSQTLRRIIAQLVPQGPEADAVRSLLDDPPTPHDLRRTVATQLAALGIAREDRLAVLGHRPDDVHGVHYDKYERSREKRIALATWERHLAKLLGKPQPGATVVPMRREPP